MAFAGLLNEADITAALAACQGNSPLPGTEPESDVLLLKLLLNHTSSPPASKHTWCFLNMIIGAAVTLSR